MKETLFKQSFEKYQNIEYRDTIRIDHIVMSNDVWDILEYDKNVNYPVRLGKKEYFAIKSQNQDKDFYVQNYGNKLCSIRKEYSMLVVEKTENKLSIKFFNGSRFRKAGVSYFKIEKNMSFLTINIETGDVYMGELNNYQKKRKFTRRMVRNYFANSQLTQIKAKFKNSANYHGEDGYKHCSDALKIFFHHLDGGKYDGILKDSDRIFKFYLDKKNIKYPNNFGLFSEIFNLKDLKKTLKKNDNKLVDSVMVYFDLSGKKIKKALHVCYNLNVRLLQDALKFFGEDWVTQDKDTIVKCLNTKSQLHFGLFPRYFGDNKIYTREEMRRIYKIFKLTFFELELDEYTFSDHLRIYAELKRYGEDNFKWQSTTIEELRKEHLDWSNTLEHYQRGNYTRIYPEYYYDILKDPIIIEDVKYFPIILDKTENYNEESSSQSNCVKMYIGKASSIIISLRKESDDSSDRATIEYSLTKENDKVKFVRIQTLGRFNSKLEDDWGEALLKLDKLVLLCIEDERYSNVKITKKCYNGTVLESDSEWDERDKKLKWTYKDREIFYDF